MIDVTKNKHKKMKIKNVSPYIFMKNDFIKKIYKQKSVCYSVYSYLTS